VSAAPVSRRLSTGLACLLAARLVTPHTHAPYTRRHITHTFIHSRFAPYTPEHEKRIALPSHLVSSEFVHSLPIIHPRNLTPFHHMSVPALRTTRLQLRVAAQNAATTATAAIAAAQMPAPAAAAAAANGAPDAMALFAQLLQQQQLQAYAAQAQQALSMANAELAAAEALAQQRRAGAGPAPTFHGTKVADELAVNTWLDAMESWFALAHVDIDADAERIEIAVASLRDSAQQWWAATRAADAAAVTAGGTTMLNKWTNVVALLRKQYLPQDPARWAMQQLETLKHGQNVDVQAYTNRFLQLDLMLVGQQGELSRVFAYEQGLPESYRVKSAERQHQTLAAAITASLALWNARSVARTQSHGGSRHGGAAKLHHTQTEDSDDEVNATEPRAPVNAGSSSSAVAKLEQKLDAFISAMQMQSGGNSRGRGGGAGHGRGRERQQEGASRPARSKTPGVSEELARQRLQARVCIKCAEPGHYARDCTNAVKTN